MFTNFFIDGGWGMYPTALFGFLLVASCGLLVLRPEKRYLWLAGSLAIATVASGLLGTSVGMINTFRYLNQVKPAEQLVIAGLGCAESLNNTVLCLLLTILAALLGTVAALRASRKLAPTT